VYLDGCVDFLTPLLCFRGLRHLVIVAPAMPSDACRVDHDGLASYLARLALSLPQRLFANGETRGSSGRAVKIPFGIHGRAVLSLAHLMSLCQLMPAVSTRTTDWASGLEPLKMPLRWTWNFEDGREVLIEYFTGRQAKLNDPVSPGIQRDKSCLICSNWFSLS